VRKRLPPFKLSQIAGDPYVLGVVMHKLRWPGFARKRLADHFRDRDWARAYDKGLADADGCSVSDVGHEILRLRHHGRAMFDEMATVSLGENGLRELLALCHVKPPPAHETVARMLATITSVTDRRGVPAMPEWFDNE